MNIDALSLATYVVREYAATTMSRVRLIEAGPGVLRERQPTGLLSAPISILMQVPRMTTASLQSVRTMVLRLEEKCSCCRRSCPCRS